MIRNPMNPAHANSRTCPGRGAGVVFEFFRFTGPSPNESPTALTADQQPGEGKAEMRKFSSTTRKARTPVDTSYKIGLIRKFFKSPGSGPGASTAHLPRNTRVGTNEQCLPAKQGSRPKADGCWVRWNQRGRLFKQAPTR